MRPTKIERLKREAEIAALHKSKEEQEGFLAWAVEKFDLDFSPPFLPQEEAILKDYFPRRWPNLLKVYPGWEFLPDMQRTNCVLVIKFNLDVKKFPLHAIKKDVPDMNIMAAISEKQGECGSAVDVDPALFKFKR